MKRIFHFNSCRLMVNLRFFLFLLCCLLTMQEASLSAQEVAIKVSMETGSWSLSSSPAYARQWMSDVPAEPRISVTATGGGGYTSTDIRGKVIPKSANNMYNPDNNEIHFYSGLGTNNYTLSYTYQIAAQVGWRIVGASLQFTSSSDDIGVAVSLNGSKTVASENTGDIQSVDVYGLNKPIVDMQVSSLGTNNVFVVAKELTITLEPEPEYVLAELKNKAITVGTAVTEFRANTWYLLYQALINGSDHDEVLQPGEKPGMGGYMWNPGEGGRFFPA